MSGIKAQRLVLHLGHGKTGSTSIQRSLRASVDVLTSAGILFPDPGRHDNHQFLFPRLHGALPDDPVQLASLGANPAAARQMAEQHWQNLLGDIRRMRPDTIVLSCENQFRPFETNALHQLSQTCAELAERTEIVVYLRSPSSFFMSNVQQDVKKRPEFRFVSASRCRDTLEPFLQHGPGPVSAIRFSREDLKDGDVVTDFVSRFLPELDASQLTRDMAEENTSASAEAMALLQDMFRGTRLPPRGYRRDLKAFRKVVIDADRKEPGRSRPVLYDHVRAAIAARVIDHDWLADTFDLRFPDSAPTMPRAKAEAIYAGLRDVTDVCPVDTNRKERLWQTAAKLGATRLGLIRRLLKT